MKVYTVSARYVEWAEFERFPDNDKHNIVEICYPYAGGEPDDFLEFELSTMNTNESGSRTCSVLGSLPEKQQQQHMLL